MVGTIHLIINCHIPEDLKPQKLEIFLGGRPIHLMLCLESILFMHLKVIWLYSRKSIHAGSSSDHLTLSKGWTDKQICLSLCSPESYLQTFHLIHSHTRIWFYVLWSKSSKKNVFIFIFI
jgi:hypothetical protein